MLKRGRAPVVVEEFVQTPQGVVDGPLTIWLYRQAADVEARLAEEAADQRARASEIRREKRMAKIKFMEEMDDRTEVTNYCINLFHIQD